MTISDSLAKKITSQVREDEIVAMAFDVVNIASPTGEELEMSKYMRAALEREGLQVSWQEVEEGRANVIGRWEGFGTGKCLMFNGHMDTSNTGREAYLTGIGYKPKAVLKNGLIYGLGIYNMKGALVCYSQAVKALQRAGVRLAGDILIAAVVGEIEKTQWSDEFVGKEFRGYGAGTHYMVNHGALPDMCILGEPTDMQIVLSHYGSIWARIGTRGNYVHTAFAAGRQQENSIWRMRDVLGEIYKWIPEFESRAAHDGKKGVVNVGCIRGGYPWRASRTPDRTDVFLDLRVPPNASLADARRAVKSLVLDLQKRFPDYGIDFETYISVPGAQIGADHELVRTIDSAHTHVLGSAPRRDTVLWCSDASVMTRFGIETVNYGPSSGPR
ncbi:MAG TPA: M20/M25/M40 family metallo-hydrolase, partial [Candidatus Acidoferrales bacterium]|nr:M20/M25/M40 family metallo-hydrolase [Candidatus Acidoferrales bacterium]